MDQLTKDYKTLVRSAWRLFSMSHRTWNAPLDKLGLSATTFAILETVIRTPGITQQEISDALSIDKSCASRGCKQLAMRGYIRREKNQTCSHGYRCHPQDGAEEAYQQALNAQQELIHAIFEKQNADGMQQCAAFMDGLIQRIEQAQNEEEPT